jgi:hypothetical protein
VGVQNGAKKELQARTSECLSAIGPVDLSHVCESFVLLYADSYLHVDVWILGLKFSHCYIGYSDAN